MDKTKRLWKIFSKSKFIEEDYGEGQGPDIGILSKQEAYRDASIVSDSVWRTKSGRIRIHMNVEEGDRYYFRDISVKGNTLYTEEHIKNVLGIQKGDVYNEELLQKRLSFSQDEEM
ncbi:MAG: hypothetical protein IPQ10_08845 [Saprospiraceae bacterium]|nr:hypothetical protein [Saprospiraceae bacterium]